MMKHQSSRNTIRHIFVIVVITLLYIVSSTGKCKEIKVFVCDMLLCDVLTQKQNVLITGGGGGATRGVRNSKETQQSGQAPMSGSEVKNGRSGAEDDAPDRLRCGTVKKEVI